MSRLVVFLLVLGVVSSGATLRMPNVESGFAEFLEVVETHAKLSKDRSATPAMVEETEYVKETASPPKEKQKLVDDDKTHVFELPDHQYASFCAGIRKGFRVVELKASGGLKEMNIFIGSPAGLQEWTQSKKVNRMMKQIKEDALGEAEGFNQDGASDSACFWIYNTNWAYDRDITYRIERLDSKAEELNVEGQDNPKRIRKTKLDEDSAAVTVIDSTFQFKCFKPGTTLKLEQWSGSAGFLNGDLKDLRAWIGTREGLRRWQKMEGTTAPENTKLVAEGGKVVVSNDVHFKNSRSDTCFWIENPNAVHDVNVGYALTVDGKISANIHEQKSTSDKLRSFFGRGRHEVKSGPLHDQGNLEIPDESYAFRCFGPSTKWTLTTSSFTGDLDGCRIFVGSNEDFALWKAATNDDEENKYKECTNDVTAAGDGSAKQQCIWFYNRNLHKNINMEYAFSVSGQKFQSADDVSKINSASQELFEAVTDASIMEQLQNLVQGFVGATGEHTLGATFDYLMLKSDTAALNKRLATAQGLVTRAFQNQGDDNPFSSIDAEAVETSDSFDLIPQTIKILSAGAMNTMSTLISDFPRRTKHVTRMCEFVLEHACDNNVFDERALKKELAKGENEDLIKVSDAGGLMVIDPELVCLRSSRGKDACNLQEIYQGISGYFWVRANARADKMFVEHGINYAKFQNAKKDFTSLFVDFMETHLSTDKLASDVEHIKKAFATGGLEVSNAISDQVTRVSPCSGDSKLVFSGASDANCGALDLLLTVVVGITVEWADGGQFSRSDQQMTQVVQRFFRAWNLYITHAAKELGTSPSASLDTAAEKESPEDTKVEEKKKDEDTKVDEKEAATIRDAVDDIMNKVEKKEVEKEVEIEKEVEKKEQKNKTEKIGLRQNSNQKSSQRRVTKTTKGSKKPFVVFMEVEESNDALSSQVKDPRLCHSASAALEYAILKMDGYEWLADKALAENAKLQESVNGILDKAEAAVGKAAGAVGSPLGIVGGTAAGAINSALKLAAEFFFNKENNEIKMKKYGNSMKQTWVGSIKEMFFPPPKDSVVSCLPGAFIQDLYSVAFLSDPARERLLQSMLMLRSLAQMNYMHQEEAPKSIMQKIKGSEMGVVKDGFDAESNKAEKYMFARVASLTGREWLENIKYIAPELAAEAGADLQTLTRLGEVGSGVSDIYDSKTAEKAASDLSADQEKARKQTNAIADKLGIKEE